MRVLRRRIARWFSSQVLPLLHAETILPKSLAPFISEMPSSIARETEAGQCVLARCQVPSSSLAVLVSSSGKRVSGAERPLAAAEATLPSSTSEQHRIHPCVLPRTCDRDGQKRQKGKTRSKNPRSVRTHQIQKKNSVFVKKKKT